MTALWDEAAGQFASFDTWGSPVNTAALVAAAERLRDTVPVPASYQKGELNTSRWVQEGFDLAVSVAYVGIEASHNASQPYLDKVAATCNQRIVLGAMRLADLLNAALGEQPPPAGPPAGPQTPASSGRSTQVLVFGAVFVALMVVAFYGMYRCGRARGSRRYVPPSSSSSNPSAAAAAAAGSFEAVSVELSSKPRPQAARGEGDSIPLTGAR